METQGRLITSGEVAKRFGVSAKTVARWASRGKIVAYKTIGGHRRYFEADVQKFIHAEHEEAANV